MSLYFLLQIAELRLQGQQLEHENGILSERHFHNIADKENLRHQLAELMKEKKRREALPAEDKHKVN